MCRPYRLSISAFSGFCNSLSYVFCLVLAGFIAGAIGSPAFAGENTNSLDFDRLAKHPALQPFDIAGKKLPSNLFLVRTRGDLPVKKGLMVHGTHKDVFLVSGDTKVVMDLTKSGCTVLPVKDLPAAAPPVMREWAWINTPDPDIAAMVAQVEWAGVMDKVQWLVDFDTRFSYAPNHGDVAESIADVFASYGLQSTLFSFYFDGTTMWNVEATQIGALYPNSYVVICGHFDSISEDPMNLAPGADDNATGTAAVLTAAEILSQYTFDNSIRYVCFGAEEQGLIGSYFYTADARQKNLDIVGALNFDMLGYWEPGVEKDLEIETNQASLWMAQAVVNAADLYTDASYELHIYDWAWWGDHFRFWLAGYPAVNHEESWDWYDPDFNPYYHTTNDLPQYLDPDFTVDNIQIGVAALATLATAGPALPVSFDVKPGSCTNPFNPKSKGVVPALVMGSAEVDVNDVNVSTLRLEGLVSPVKVKFADVGSTSDGGDSPCHDVYQDGLEDMLLKFSAQDIAAVLGPAEKGDVVTLQLTGRLFDGTVITGEDVIAIAGKSGAPVLAGQPFDDPITDSGRSAPKPEMPERFALHQNVPNPFNPNTNIIFDVPPGGGSVTLRIYDVNGRLVRTLVDGPQNAGQKTVVWDGLNETGNQVATGAYFYRMTGPGFEQTRKMMLLK